MTGPEVTAAMKAEDVDAAREVARVLIEHHGWGVTGERVRTSDVTAYGCRGCPAEIWRDEEHKGWTAPAMRERFADHQAAMLAEAGLLREATDSAEPCTSEVWSMDYYRDGQVDPYWIRCNAIGPHVEHEDANTGLTWTTDDPEEAQIATQEPAGATQGGSGDSRVSGGLDGALDACGAKSEPFLIRDSDQKPIHYLVKICNLPAGHGRPHHWPVLTFAIPGFTEVAS
jgi:hypothetical protein